MNTNPYEYVLAVARHANFSRAVTIYTTAFFTLGMLKTLEDELVSMGFPETTILELDTHEIVELIKEDPTSGIGIVNVPLSMYGDPPASGAVEFEELFSSSLAVMGTTKLISPRKKRITAKDMRALPISYPNFPVLNEMVDELFDHYKPGNVASRTSNLASIDRSVLAGKTATITDTITAFLNRDEKDRLYVELDYPVYSNVGFVFSPRAEGIDVRRSYMDAIRNYMKSILGPYIKAHPPKQR